MSDTEEVRVGDLIDFPGRTFNILVRNDKRQQAKNQREAIRGTGSRAFMVVRARNKTGETIYYGGGVALDGIEYKQTDDDTAPYTAHVTGAVFNSSSIAHSTIGICLDHQVEDDDVGSFAISGQVYARVRVNSVDDKFIDLPSDQDEAFAETTGSGFPILGWQDDPVEDGLAFVLVQVGSGGGGGSVEKKIVLIFEDIKGIDEADPPVTVTALSVTLSDAEVGDGWTAVAQDPPDDDLTVNNVDSLDRKVYRRRKVTVKVYEPQSPITGGLADTGSADSITLAPGASSITDYYKGDIIEIVDGRGVGQSGACLSYDGGTRELVVDPPWPTDVPDETSQYSITSTKTMALATTTVDDTDAKIRALRYLTMDAWYDDTEGVTLGYYGKADYEKFHDYDENGQWPPDGFDSATDPFFRKPVRGIVIDGLLIDIFCSSPPPPPLPEE